MKKPLFFSHSFFEQAENKQDIAGMHKVIFRKIHEKCFPPEFIAEPDRPAAPLILFKQRALNTSPRSYRHIPVKEQRKRNTQRKKKIPAPVIESPGSVFYYQVSEGRKKHKQ